MDPATLVDAGALSSEQVLANPKGADTYPEARIAPLGPMPALWVSWPEHGQNLVSGGDSQQASLP